MLKACDILNYFLKDLFYERNVTYINKIFISFESKYDDIAIIYPGGLFNTKNDNITYK